MNREGKNKGVGNAIGLDIILRGLDSTQISPQMIYFDAV